MYYRTFDLALSYSFHSFQDNDLVNKKKKKSRIPLYYCLKQQNERYNKYVEVHIRILSLPPAPAKKKRRKHNKTQGSNLRKQNLRLIDKCLYMILKFQ